MSWTQQRPALQVIREKQGLRQKSELVALTNQSGATPAQAVVAVKTPSRRLSAMVEVFFEPLTDAESSIVLYNATWTTRAKAIGIRLSDANLNPINSALALPDSYELDSAIRILRVQADFTTPPTNALLAFVFGTWYLRARWEPNTPMTDEELNQLFNDCHVE
jgi:hypothetical protein